MLPEDLAAALTTARERRPDARLDVRWHASLPSTMDAGSSLAHEAAAHGVVIIADEQTAGRGRRGATWASPALAGLYFSFIARPGIPRDEASSTLPLVTLAAGVAVQEGVQAATGLAADLKWPNDLIIGTRKLAGILAEGVAIGSPDQAVVIGVGVNVQPGAYPPEIAARATSIEGELGRRFDRGALLTEILVALWDRLAALELKPGDILQAWRAVSPSAIGTRVEWDGKHGTTAGIDDGGALLVATSTGVERIISGELRWHLASP